MAHAVTYLAESFSIDAGCKLSMAYACMTVWMMQVPYDPHLPFLFFGEEMMMLARMWTHGWDVFAPTQVRIALCMRHVQLL